MFYYSMLLFVSLILDVLSLRGTATIEKDIEILALRHQVRLLQRKLQSKPRFSRFEKLLLAVLAAKLKRCFQSTSARLSQSLLVLQPETILKWHRELVRRKWTFHRTNHVGRPRTSAEVEALVVRLAKENQWGADRICGELLKLGFKVGATTVREILARYGIPPAPLRSRRGNSWRRLLSHYRAQVLASDFFTVETVWLKTIYVLFFIELGTRRVYIAGCTDHPTSAWVTQQARQLIWTLADKQPAQRFLIHDRDTKFTRSFDAVFMSEGLEILLTPRQAPNANAFAERWVRTVRQECLDHLLIANETHLRRVLAEYVTHYNTARPHQGINQQLPSPPSVLNKHGPILRRNILGGIIHEYFHEAA